MIISWRLLLLIVSLWTCRMAPHSVTLRKGNRANPTKNWPGSLQQRVPPQFTFYPPNVAVRHTIQKSVSLLNKCWSYQANAPRLDSRLHCRSFDPSHCHDPNRNFTHLEHSKGGIDIRFAGTEAPPARCGCGADVPLISSLTRRRPLFFVLKESILEKWSSHPQELWERISGQFVKSSR